MPSRQRTLPLPCCRGHETWPRGYGCYGNWPRGCPKKYMETSAIFHFYRPQRSWAKVMFLQVSVILSTGGGGFCLSACWDAGPPRTRDTLPDQADPPEPGSPPGPGRPPRTRQTPPGPRRPPLDHADPPGPGRPPPPPKQTPAYGQWAAGTHPTGMHSCNNFCFSQSFSLSIGARKLKINLSWSKNLLVTYGEWLKILLSAVEPRMYSHSYEWPPSFYGQSL